MPDTNSIGFLESYDAAPEIRPEISTFAKNWFTNRCPLICRLPRKTVGSPVYSIATRNFRRRVTFLAAAVSSSSGTSTLTLTDVSSFMVGDVLEIPNTAGTYVEHVQILSDPNVSANTVSVQRGSDNTTPIANDFVTGNYLTVKLIGNSRTGAEYSQSATNYLPSSINQYNQIYQHPVQVAGSLEGSTSFVRTPDASSPFQEARMEALQNLMDDMEVSSYYGIGESPTSGSGRPKQKGVKAQIVTNVTLNGAFSTGQLEPVRFIGRTISLCTANGGKPDTILCDQNWLQGLTEWGYAVQRIDAGATELGTPIEKFCVSFLPDLEWWLAPLLGPNTAFVFDRNEVFWRPKRTEFWNQRGTRGDLMEGDWMAEGSIEVENEDHHAWIEGFEGFAAY